MKMKYTFTLLTLLSSFTFGQYVKNATIVLDNGKKIETEEIIYGEKEYQFVEKEVPYTLQTVKIKKVSNIEFDSINFSKEIPKLKETYFENDLPEGIYETIEDFYNRKPSSTEKLAGRPDGEDFLERPKDLMTFKRRSDDEILRTAFAVVYYNDLYFGVKGINKNESKKMKGSANLGTQSMRYVRVKFKNDDYYYTDFPVSSNSTFWMVAGGVAGGMIGGAIAGALSSNHSGYVPIVLLNSEKKFYKVQGCKKFNEYFGTNLNMNFDCENKEEYNIQNVRKLMINNIK
ncbi:hypothetical protein GCM10010984_00640 [Chishuiella changwenlii]|uniref:GLPGLI family protein n=2 Tax=Chishuiella changwenlii TaxID=1434701 RepID=A0ABQ1T704_9FLAO|nr:hypothetical protein GCM10010984_00640 [Chishuiella changwenlii]